TGDTFCERGPRPVGSSPGSATPEGVHDLAGNVAEWVGDWYGRYPEAKVAGPTGPQQGTLKVIRGGGFLDVGLALRTRARTSAPPHLRSENVGFRCASDGGEPAALPAGLVRGELGTLADEGRVAAPPRPPEVAPPELIASGLNAPGAVVRRAGALVVAEAGTGTVIELSGDDRRVLHSGARGPLALAVDGDRLYVAERAGGRILRLDAATTVVAEGENGPSHVAAGHDEVAWATADAIRRASGAGSAETLVGGLDGVAGLALTATHVYFAEAGAADPTRARLARVARGGGEADTLVDSGFFGTGAGSHQPTDVALAPDGSRLWFLVRLRGWPGSGFACHVAIVGGNPACVSYSPPYLDRLVVAGGALFWTTQRSVVSAPLSSPAPFRIPATWTSPGGLAVDAESLVWTDRQSGRVYRVPRDGW
ncbi:MAG: SUMF1/EgtB/PvdO family nonheme iron enzyme, partial [Myxococcales bacterium]